MKQTYAIGVDIGGSHISCAAVDLESFKILDEKVETTSGHVSISTMHLAKGLEFRAVVVMACDDEVIPLQERIETVADDADLEEVYNTERHLLYVACTRARDYLLVTSVAPASEFLDDLETGGGSLLYQFFLIPLVDALVPDSLIIFL